MAFCTKCGTRLADDANFCGKCGTATGAAAQGNAAGSTAQAGGTAKTVEDALKELNELAGLASVKEAVAKIAAEPEPRHLVFMVKPENERAGSKVGRILADIFKATGVLPTNNVVKTYKSKLLSFYVGQTIMQVNNICDSAMGGILYIEDAHELKINENDSFVQEAIETLLIRMEDDRGKFVVIMSGDTKKMEEFLQSNSGFRSRITDCLNFEE